MMITLITYFPYAPPRCLNCI